MNKYLSPYFQILLASIIRGSGGIFIKTINLPSPSIAFFRLAIPTLLVGGRLIRKRSKLFQQDTQRLLFMSVFNALRMYLFFIGYLYTSIGNAIVSQKMSPIFTVILAAIFLGEHITPRKIQSILLALIGVICVYLNKEFSLANNDVLGISAILLSAVISAYIHIVFKKVIKRHTKQELIFYQCLAGGFIFLPFVLITQPFPDVSQISLGIVYAVTIGIIGFMLYFNGLKHVSVGKAKILTYVEIISAMVLAFFFLGEIPERNTLLGALLIMIAIYRLRYEQ